ncbi:hypothetical protein HOG11_04195, partial [bacterium]|nr:hypothetical protein [bacterium]
MIGTINIKTRPLKIAFLVDPKSSTQVKKAIQLSSTLWGGSFFPIIQLYKIMPATWKDGTIKAPLAKDVILGYLDAFDPDILIQLSKSVPKYIVDSGLKIIKSNEIWDNINEDFNLIPSYGLGIYEILDDIFEQDFKYKMKYPMKIAFPELPRKYSLFWSSFFGEILPEVIPNLKKHYYGPLEIETPKFEIKNLNKMLKNNILFPRRITLHKINNNSHTRFGRDACIYFMDANKVEDIVDYWNLRAMGRVVMPVAKQMKSEPVIKKIVINFLKMYRRPWKHNPTVCDRASIIRSRNCTMEEVENFAKTIKIKPDSNDLSKDSFYVLQHWYPRVWDEWARDKDGAIPDNIYGSQEESFDVADLKNNIRFTTLLPDFADKYSYHGNPRCANEVIFSFYGADEYIAEVFPKSSAKNFIREISGLMALRGNWRVGNNGLVRLVEDNSNETINIPLSENIVIAWLKDLGWEPKLSSSGKLAKQIHKQLNGYLSTLKNEKLLNIFEHMNGGSVNIAGSPKANNKINQEREMPIGEIKRRLSDKTRGDKLHNYLVEKGVFKLGIRIKCPYCSRKSWFELEKISNNFLCQLCLNDFSAIGNLENSIWCYKTVGPFSIPNYAEGAYAVLLALDFFNEYKMTTMRITPLLSFSAITADKENIEADFAAFWQDSVYGQKKDGLLFSECKTYGMFEKKDFTRMRYLAKTFPGAILVFSTLRKSLTRNEIIELKKITKSGRKYWKS